MQHQTWFCPRDPNTTIMTRYPGSMKRQSTGERTGLSPLGWNQNARPDFFRVPIMRAICVLKVIRDLNR
ncbi:uncharacterized protein N7500_009749 [Penicillium coprophilum]|uniref:uncharacterized protein n=1 Tax=Penicillium coprophilum TaxID=36646 RepID=UPI0023A5C09D|nr:uncharacterized protein N7500_009749 [Penicillium coprophilum]KAJ5154310.1 hypothetical protein N7500_009749 [Penicillium coprophilum]